MATQIEESGARLEIDKLLRLLEDDRRHRPQLH